MNPLFSLPLKPLPLDRYAEKGHSNIRVGGLWILVYLNH